MGSLDVASNDASKAPVTEDPEKPREINDPSGVVAADVDVGSIGGISNRIDRK